MPKLSFSVAIFVLLAAAPQVALAQETPEEIRNRAVLLLSGSADDKAKAVAEFEAAAAAGDAPSMSLLGGIYLNGDGVTADRATAVYWFYQAALVDQPGALEKLAELAAGDSSANTSTINSAAALREGGLVYWYDEDDANDTEAVVYFRMAAEQGDTRALGLLGDAYFSGYGVAADIPTAFYWYEQGATAGDTESMTTLANLYRYGNGVDEDLDTAFQYASDAAAAGSPLGMRYLGDMYRLGEGTPKTFEAARDNLEAAAEAGDIDSLPLLGELYETDEGNGPPDLVASFEAYRKAYDAGITSVALSLADDYRKGAGTAKDVAKAIGLLVDATEGEEGHEAMTILGDIYVGGENGRIDTERAASWYVRASDLGDSAAQVKLADLYRRGAGVARDVEYARLLLETALSNGEDVQNQIDELPDAAALKTETAFARALVLASGPLGPKDEEQLRGLYLTAADKDSVPEAMLLLADMLSDGLGGAESDKDALKWRLRAADAGNVDAMIAAGRDYELGVGTDADREKALALYLRASSEGSEPALLEFERLTDTPVLIAMSDDDKAKARGFMEEAAVLASSERSADKAKVLKLYADAASLGEADAMFAYGSRVAFDKSARTRDRTRAFQWLEYAAKTGNVSAMGLIAGGYARGEATAKDHRAGTRWYRRAADGGDIASLVPAADFFINGAATPADTEAGQAWLESALAQKIPGAAFVAAKSRLPGGGLAQDPEGAAAFMIVALGEGDIQARRALSRESWSAQPEAFRKAVQQQFSTLGLYDGAIDGLFGSRTAAAVARIAEGD